MQDNNGLGNINKILRALQIQDAVLNRPKGIERIHLDLSTAATWSNPLQFDQAFRSLFVESLSDPNAYCYFKPNSQDVGQQHVRLGIKDGYVTDDELTGRAFFSWPAQPGKWMEIVVFYNARFQSGSYTQIQAGGVNISEGTSAALASVTLPATAATIIAPASASRVVATIQNKTGGDIFVGDSTVTDAGATEGILIADGEKFQWKNAAALYAYSVSGGKVNRLEET